VTTTRARSAPAAADPISHFFDELAKPGHLATFESESATIRLDVPEGEARTDRWFITIHDGDVSVSHNRGPADAVLTLERPAAVQLVAGRLNAQAAVLRGLLTCEGNMAACIMFQRCLPGPPGSVGRVAPISSAAVMAKHK
jgi:putative sterol carrier protein